MKLVLSVGGKVLEKVFINQSRSKNDDYIQAQKRLLLIKHDLSIVALKEDPIFYLEAYSKFSNQKKKRIAVVLRTA